MSDTTPNETAPAVSTRYTVAKRVVSNSTAETLEGALLDLFTASAMVAVYEAMNDANRARFDSIPLDRLASFCLSKVSAR
ncbi:MAG: hypothetical protein K0S37_797 [Microbacterium sp.]|jgi:hypothetical protein|nr:hypothetical protein [Microbacterium sp.]